MSARTGFVSLLLPDETSRRAFEEALADWAEERGRATTLPRRVWTEAQGCLSLARVVLGVARRELVTPEAWRNFAWTVLLAMIVAAANPLNWLYSARGFLAPRLPESLMIGVLLVPNSLVVAFAIVSALGPGQGRSRPGRPLASLVLASVFMFLVLGWVTPAANQQFRTTVARLSTPRIAADRPAGAPMPGLTELAMPDLVRQAFADRGNIRGARRVLSVRLALLLATPTGFLLGAAIRQRIGNRAPWRVRHALGAVALISAGIAGNYSWPLLAKLFSWPIAVRLERLNADLWLALVLAWAAMLLISGNSEPDQRTRNPEPTAPPASTESFRR